MPKSIATAVAPQPMLNNEQPSNNPLSLIVPDGIRQKDGLYCLNDLHKMAGGNKKHQPTNFMRRSETKQLIAELERSSHSCTSNSSDRSSDMRSKAYLIIQGGEMQGTYVCRELVYAYANWISPAFYLVVIRTFDRLTNLTLTERYNIKNSEYKTLKSEVSEYASKLCIHGKKTLPRMVRELNELLEQMQPQLPFEGE